jgi:ATP-dependent Zn protease
MSSLYKGINYTPTDKKDYYNSNIYTDDSSDFHLRDFFNKTFNGYTKGQYITEKQDIISKLNNNDYIKFGESIENVSGNGNKQDNETINRLSEYKHISTDKKLYDKNLDNLNKKSASQNLIISIIIILFIITFLLSYLYFFTDMVSNMTYILYFIFVLILCFLFKFIITRK